MVEGLNRFKEHFRDYVDRYVLIGGTACEIALDAVGIEFRRTQDLDIVLCIEAFDREFADAFWEFIRKGQYHQKENEAEKRQYYRFRDPGEDGYPIQLELFSRVPDALSLFDGSRFTPIPTDDDASSLSAILVDDVYYDFIRSGQQVVDGLSIVGAEHLIPLKAFAWLNLTRDKNHGSSIDSRKIKRHKNDVFRLSRILDPESNISIHKDIKDDVRGFISSMRSEGVGLGNLKISSQSLDDILALFARVYALDRS